METKTSDVPATKETVWEWETVGGPIKLTMSMVRRYICPEASDGELFHFLALCRAHRLNPLIREAYLIKYGTAPATLVVGKDFFIRRANSYPQFGGFTAGITVVKKQAEQVVLDRREGELVLDGETLVGGWCDVFRKGIDQPFRAEVSFKEYCKMKDGKPFRSWAEMPGTMIRKVALVHALREAFPEEFQGIYDESEIERPEPLTIEMPKSVTEAKTESPAAPAASGVSDGPEKPAPSAGDSSPPPQNGAELRKKVWAMLTERASADKTTPTKLLYKLTKKQNMPELTDAEVQGLLVQLG